MLPDNRADELTAGNYTLMVIDRKNCAESFDVEVMQPEQISIYAAEGDLVNPDCDYSANGSIRATVNGGVEPYTYLWVEPNIANTDILENLTTGDYTLSVTDNHNCTVVNTFELESLYAICLEIPSAFSPNGDGRNDTWIIENRADRNQPVAGEYPSLVVEVFDRRGVKVWTSERGYSHSVTNGWDGRDKGGTLLPFDTYYYFMHVEDTGLELQGIVTIIR
jgi:gliding motility-associated-like protein